LESQDASKRALADPAGDKKGEDKGQSIFSSYIKRIQDNLRIEIKNVHIRLEDQKETDVHGQGPGVKAYEQMCIGVSLREIGLQTIDYKPSDAGPTLDDDEDSEVPDAAHDMVF